MALAKTLREQMSSSLDLEETQMSSLDLSLGSLLSGSAGPIVQEVLVLSVFAASFLLWRRLGHRAECRKSSSKSKGWAPSPSQHPGLAPRLEQQLISAPVEVCVSHPQASRLEKQIMTYLEQREFTRALNLFRSVERGIAERGNPAQTFGEELFSAFIQSAVRMGKIDIMEHMLQSMKQRGIVPSCQSWRVIMKLASSRKCFQACLYMYSVFEKEAPADKVIFSCLMNAALEVGSPERAAAMIGRYSEAGLEAKDRVLLLRVYMACGDADRAEATLHAVGQDATTLMLNMFLSICTSTKQPERGLRLLRQMQGQPETAGGGKGIADVISYNIVMKGFVEAGSPQQGLRCLRELVGQGLEPDPSAVCSLVDACVASRDAAAADEILDAACDWSNAAAACAALVKTLVRAKCLDKALDLQKRMKQRGHAGPDIVMYSLLIKALVDAGRLDAALCLKEDMFAAGYKVDDIVLTHLLEGCRHAGNYELGKKLFQDALADGLQLSEYTLITMLKLCGRCGLHQEAYQLLAGWEETQGRKPSVIHFTCVMSGCVLSRKYDMAWATYELMLSSKIRPDATTLSTLLPAMVAAQRWERVVDLAVATSAIGELGVAATREAMSSAVLQMRRAGQTELADRLRGMLSSAEARASATAAARGRGGSGGAAATAKTAAAAGAGGGRW